MRFFQTFVTLSAVVTIALARANRLLPRTAEHEIRDASSSSPVLFAQSGGRFVPSPTDLRTGANSNDNGRLSAALAAWAWARPRQLVSQLVDRRDGSAMVDVELACPMGYLWNYTASFNNTGPLSKWPINKAVQPNKPAWPAIVEQVVAQSMGRCIFPVKTQVIHSSITATTSTIVQVSTITETGPSALKTSVTTATVFLGDRSYDVESDVADLKWAVKAMVEPDVALSNPGWPLLGLTFLYGATPADAPALFCQAQGRKDCPKPLNWLSEFQYAIGDDSAPLATDTYAMTQVSRAHETPTIARAKANGFGLPENNIFVVLGQAQYGKIGMYNPWGSVTRDDSKLDPRLQKPGRGDPLYGASGAFVMNVLDWQNAFGDLAYVAFRKPDTVSDGPIVTATSSLPALNIVAGNNRLARVTMPSTGITFHRGRVTLSP